MITTFITISLNLLISAVLIFGIGPFPALGVVGAAIATVIARVVEMVILVSVSYGKKYALAGKPAELFGYDALFVKRFFTVALPVMINEILWSLGVSVQNVIFARTDTTALAAFNITSTFSQLVWVVFIGLGNGVAVLIGKKIGEGNEATARDYAARITLFAPLVAFALSFTLYPLSRLLPFFFNVDPSVFGITGMMFLILAVSYPFRAFNMSMIIGVCRSGGDTVFSIFYDISIMWLITLPLAAAASFIFHAPAWGLYLCLCTEDPLKMGLGLWRLKSGKWLHNVTR
jgi:Na+-driven multidrug efflux pump